MLKNNLGDRFQSYDSRAFRVSEYPLFAGRLNRTEPTKNPVNENSGERIVVHPELPPPPINSFSPPPRKT